MRTFKRGDKVAIISQTMGGKFRVEGKASVATPTRWENETMTDDDYKYRRHFTLLSLRELRLSLRNPRYCMFYGSETRDIIRRTQRSLVTLRRARDGA